MTYDFVISSINKYIEGCNFSSDYPTIYSLISTYLGYFRAFMETMPFLVPVFDIFILVIWFEMAKWVVGIVLGSHNPLKPSRVINVSVTDKNK